MSYKDNYGFVYKAKQTVYKWWCVVYKPAYKLFHQGYWPKEKEPYYAMNQAKEKEEQAAKLAQAANVDAEDLANSILSSKQGSIDDMVANTSPISQEAPAENTSEPELDLSQVDPDALARANEIMARLASEAAADEAKKQAEIDAAKAKALEDERAAKARADEIMARLASEAAADEAKKQAEIDAAKAKADEDAKVASIMKAAKVDISVFIEEGKAHRNDS